MCKGKQSKATPGFKNFDITLTPETCSVINVEAICQVERCIDRILLWESLPFVASWGMGGQEVECVHHHCLRTAETRHACSDGVQWKCRACGVALASLFYWWRRARGEPFLTCQPGWVTALIPLLVIVDVNSSSADPWFKSNPWFSMVLSLDYRYGRDGD